MKTCTKCNIEKDLNEYYLRKDNNSYRSECKSCISLQRKEYSIKNRESIKLRNKKWNENKKNDLEYISNRNKKSREKYQLIKEQHKILRQNWYKVNKENYLLGRKDYYNNHKKEFRQRDAKRRAIEINARPSWVSNKEMKEIYKNCPEGFEVDHIIPLNNKIVCGLDVPWNLQYLEKSKNRSKGNKLEVSLG